MTDQTAETAAADLLVAETRRAVHESLIFLAAPEADRVRALIADLETAVEGRTAIRDAARTAAARQTTPAGSCGCGAPATPDVVHRQGAPCYMDQDGGLQTVELPTAAARQTTGQDASPPPPAVNPACTTCKPAPAVGQPAEAHDTDRAAVLAEAADRVALELTPTEPTAPLGYRHAIADVVRLLRRLGDEEATR